MSLTRRELIRTSAVAAAVGVGSSIVQAAEPAKPQAATTAATTQANSRPGLAIIGNGGIARWFGQFFGKYADIVCCCDVDRAQADKYNADFAKGKAAVVGDYRAALDRKDVDVLYIGTPDHWHTKIAADAMYAGKDVYCEKPLTLTIDEGRILQRVARETFRVLQVGTQQRSEEQFLKAVALAHAGRLGRIRHVTVAVGDTPAGSGFQTAPVPEGLDWNQWLGQAPKVDYIKQRCHFDFRWWYEYSGGRITDWGAHHVDIAQWAVAPDLPGPSIVEPVFLDMSVPFERGYPMVNNAFNTAPKFNVRCTFANGVEMYIRDRVDGFPSDNGILIEGDGGYLFVNRERLTGNVVDQLKDDPLPAWAIPTLNKSFDMGHERHFVKFLDCVRTRETPNSDVWSHCRHLNTCHLANIAMRLNRKIHWDASAQRIVGDAEADAFTSRAQRRGFEIS